MDVADVILLLLGAVCFAAATFRVTTERAELVPLGLLLWILVPLIHALDALT